jgi:vitamin B12 transporter
MKLQERLLVTLWALAWTMHTHAEDLPKIKVHPSAVETGTVYQSKGTDVVEALTEIPSIYFPSVYTGQVFQTSFRGLASAHTLVSLDGIPINDATAGMADLSRFNITGADKITVLSGPEVLLQTSQAGGILQLNTNDTEAGTKGAAALGSFNTVAGNIKSTFKHAHGSHTLLANHEQTTGLPKYDKVRILGERNRYHQENAGIISHTQVGDRTWLKTYARAFSSVLKYDDAHPPLPSKPQGTKNGAIYILGAEANHESPSGKWQQQLATSYTKQNLSYGPTSSTENQETVLAYRHDVRWAWAHRTRFVGDTTVTHQDQLNLKKQRSVSGIAALHGVRLTDTWSAEAGVRQDHTQKYKMAPRLTSGVAWEKDKTKLYGSWRQATRLPKLSDLYVNSPWETSNPTLKGEKMDLMELGWREKLSANSTLQLVYFYNRLNNMMKGTQLSSGSWMTQNIPGTSVLQGMETSLYHTWQNQVSLKGSYTYTSTSFPRHINDKPIAPKHHAYVHLEIPMATQWSVTPSVEYVSQRFNGNEKLQPYILNHLEVAYKITKACQIYGQVKNMWDEGYETIVGYRSPRRTFYVGTRFSL